MNSHEFVFEGEELSTTSELLGNQVRVVSGEREFLLSRVGENLYSLTVNGKAVQAAAVRHQGVFYIDIDSILLEVKEPSEDGFAGGAGGHEGEKDKIYAPMPGKIVKILVAVGDEIEVKQPMVIVEAMKMENQVNSQAAGKVKAVNFAAGDQVDTESPIIELELAE
ncbi:MAG: acetyl-CoA carboxylase biotin carboxyl carrier protein subunit [Candidatus Zixiibacteriota bacterium]|nr:MAG: acetyl-CoA carboxylase biotin carboxyl carrier protein subunit [candidate division Zixibacteria bacterium]